MAEVEAPSDEHRPKRRKVSGGDLYRDILGSPKLVVAPMVDQSELPWRILSRRYGGQLVYTPMINAKMFAEGKNKTYRDQAFNLIHGEEGGPSDRPLIVQFCANNPEKLLEAARLVEPHCDAVDINFGCPQDIARRGHYGCFLQDDWDLIYKLINILHVNLSIPVTAKFRVFPTVERTVEYAKMMERAGAQILTCHGRVREQRGQRSGLADWTKIRAVKEAVSVPVFANGNILFHGDIQRCLDETGADAIMTAEGNLYNPTILLNTSHLTSKPLSSSRSDETSSESVSPSSTAVSNRRDPSEYFTFKDDPGIYLPTTALAHEYLSIVRSLQTPTHNGAIKGHLFKLLRPSLGSPGLMDLRVSLGKINGRKSTAELVDEYAAVVSEVESRLKDEIEDVRTGKVDLEGLVKVDEGTGLRVLPRWLAQPYFRTSKTEEKKTKDITGVAVAENGSSEDARCEVEAGSVARPATEVTPSETGVEGVVEGPLAEKGTVLV